MGPCWLWGEPQNRAVLRLPEFRAMLLATGCGTLAGRSAALTVAYQLCDLTKNPLTLDLGEVEDQG